MQEGDSRKLNFEGLEMQKWNIATDTDRRADEKNEVILSSFHGYFSYQKRRDSLEGSLDQVFFSAELEFPKI